MDLRIPGQLLVFRNSISFTVNSNQKIAFKALQEIRQLSAVEYFKGIKPKQAFKKKFFENEYQIKRFEWMLFAYRGTVERDEKERFQAPFNHITTEFKADFVAECLNFSNCFDFDYQPKENDLLKIKMNYIFKAIKGHERESDLNWGFMLFKFQSGKWLNLNTNPFKNEWQTIAQGIVEIVPNKKQSFVQQRCIIL